MGDPEDDPDHFECSRCGTSVPAEEAVAITRSKQLWKPLCPDCLGEIGVPRGYELVRDLSHLR